MRYWIPTRPYSLIDAINRMASATGSVRYVQLSANSDYNGHMVTVYFNSYRKYWLCEHYFGERVVHCRSHDVKKALEAGVYEHNLGHRGTTVMTDDLEGETAEYAEKLGYVPYTKEIGDEVIAMWMDDRYHCVNSALAYERQVGIPGIKLLLESTDAKDFERRVGEWCKANRRRAV